MNSALAGLLRRLVYIFVICLEYLNMNWTTRFFTLLSRLDDHSAIPYVKEYQADFTFLLKRTTF